MKIKKIGNIELTYPLWWVDYNDSKKIKAEVSPTIDGGVIVWEQQQQNNSEFITLDSLTDGWQTFEVKDDILTLINNSLGTPTTITTIDDEVINVRFRHEVSSKFVRLVNNYEFKYYNCKIYLARV
jgi:hypothetical protein